MRNWITVRQKDGRRDRCSHSLGAYLLSTNYMPGPVQSIREAASKRSDTCPKSIYKDGQAAWHPTAVSGVGS